MKCLMIVKLKFLDTDSDVPTTSLHKQLPSCPLFSTSVSATSGVK